MLVQASALQAGGDLIVAFAILAVAIGIAGVAILFLFSRKKI